MSITKFAIAAVAATSISSAAFAGSMAEPEIEPIVPQVIEEVAPASSSDGGLIVPLMALLLLAAAASSSGT